MSADEMSTEEAGQRFLFAYSAGETANASAAYRWRATTTASAPSSFAPVPSTPPTLSAAWRNRAPPRRKPKPSACGSNGRRGPTVNAGALPTSPARSSAGACIATTRTQTTARKLKTDISLSIVPERPKR